MTAQKVIESHQLTVTFDQLEDNTVNWTVTASDEVAELSHCDYPALAAADVSLAAMGIRALWDFCAEVAVELALERASLAQWQEWGNRVRQAQSSEPDWAEVAAEALAS